MRKKSLGLPMIHVPSITIGTSCGELDGVGAGMSRGHYADEVAEVRFEDRFQLANKLRELSHHFGSLITTKKLSGTIMVCTLRTTVPKPEPKPKPKPKRKTKRKKR